MRPFQPTVVRGFSKYTRITTKTSGLRLLCHCQRFETRGIVHCGVGVMDRARPDHNHQTVVRLLQNRLNDRTRRIHVLGQWPFCRQLCNERLGHHQLAQILNAKIISVGGHHLVPLLPRLN